MALKPENPVVGGTVLRRAAIQSPNYSPGVSGWTIKQDGSAEFNNLTLRGTFNGNDWILNATGFFLYSGIPAQGNLATSIVPGSVAVTDPEGNTAQPGITVYATPTQFMNLDGAVMSWQFTTGQPQLASIFQVGAAGTLELQSGEQGAGDSNAIIELLSALASGTGIPVVQLLNNVTVSGNLTVTGTANINGSSSVGFPNPNATSTNGIANGQIAGTSGGASAGTAHTHGAGSYAVTSGQHSHDLQNHGHPL